MKLLEGFLHAARVVKKATLGSLATLVRVLWRSCTIISFSWADIMAVGESDVAWWTDTSSHLISVTTCAPGRLGLAGYGKDANHRAGGIPSIYIYSSGVFSSSDKVAGGKFSFLS